MPAFSAAIRNVLYGDFLYAMIYKYGHVAHLYSNLLHQSTVFFLSFFSFLFFFTLVHLCSVSGIFLTPRLMK